LKVKDKKIKTGLILLGCAVVLLPIIWILAVRMEGERPDIKVTLTSTFLGVRQEIPITVSDRKSGIRKIRVSLFKNGSDVVLFEQTFPRLGFLGKGKHRDETPRVSFEPKRLKIDDGPAVLRMVATDYAWRRWWHGNRTYIEKEVTIDTIPPGIDVLSQAHYISPGGAGLVIYRTSEPCRESGVDVGKGFFPGHSGYFKDKNVRIAFIALNYDQGQGTAMIIRAADHAGNQARAGFPHHIKRKNFRKDTLEISDRFLSWKMPEFESEIPEASKRTLLDKFLWVNRDLRKLNYEAVCEVGNNTGKRLYWEGAFLRLPNSARKASFADHRTYTHKGRAIDNQVHLGIDLASVEHSSVTAANSGKVVFAETLGIYGKTVIIDHGFGLFSMYSHLNKIDVQSGQTVTKGDRIGFTGRTGLAGGDHLHFGMLIHHTFVNPVEWWDGAWIENNITNKLTAVKSRIGE
jgi:murein DD-endopeptidase MepM/ murein hydrolase activator NlpD